MFAKYFGFHRCDRLLQFVDGGRLRAGQTLQQILRLLNLRIPGFVDLNNVKTPTLEQYSPKLQK